MKHTQGQWIANEKRAVQVEPENPLKTTTICQVFGDNEEAEANAKLIASAPELLEALKSVKSLNLHLYEDGTIGNRVYKEVMAAIASATE